MNALTAASPPPSSRCSPPPALADVNIGVSLPLTGPGSGLGIPMKN